MVPGGGSGCSGSRWLCAGRQSLVASHGLADIDLVALRDSTSRGFILTCRDSRYTGLRDAGLSSFVDDSHRGKNQRALLLRFSR